MSESNPALPAEPTLFCALLTPHRSLGGVGFVVLMSVIAAVSFVGGLAFFLVGAWPVGFFFGLDALLIYVAFRVNYRAADAYEEVTVTPSELRVRKVTHHGKVSEWSLNPVWVRLERETHDDRRDARCDQHRQRAEAIGRHRRYDDRDAEEHHADHLHHQEFLA